MDNKNRLDVALTESGLTASREKAKTLIKEGKVYVNGIKREKAGFTVAAKDSIEIRGELMPFVSRGGYKLHKALDCFDIDLTDAVCVDIGASTGGFTDCMLQAGARRVYSVDVGFDQLDSMLREDNRVVNMEKTNFRNCVPEDFADTIDFAATDVSFISLRLILPALYHILSENGRAVCLIKPQFEAGKDKIGKNGVVKEPRTHINVIKGIISFASEEGFKVSGLDYSPVKGPKGNIEYLLLLEKNEDAPIFNGSVEEVVSASHKRLKRGEEI